MNKTLLLIIVDFLFLNLIALTRWEKSEPVRPNQPPVTQVSANAVKDEDMVSVMRESLADEQATRQKLQTKLESADSALAARQQTLEQIQTERSKLSSDLTETKRAAAELGRRYESATQEATLSKEQLAQLQRELEDRRTEAERQKLALSALERQQSDARRRIESLTVGLAVAEQQKQQLQDEASSLSTQVQSERSERLKVEQTTNQLASGVGQLAQNSGELTKEIRDNRPISPNVLFNNFIANRVVATFSASRPGMLGKVDRSKDARTVFVTDGKQAYALVDIRETIFDLPSENDPAVDWENLGVSLSHDALYKAPASEVQFLSADPRVIAVPVDPKQVSELGVRVYHLAADPFKFSEALLIDGSGKGYGDVAFKLDPSNPGYVRVDNRFFKRLFGDFAPSRGDLVFSQTGEFIGVMINSDYCAVVKAFSPVETLRTGEAAGQHTSAVVTSIANQVARMPDGLQ